MDLLKFHQKLPHRLPLSGTNIAEYFKSLQLNEIISLCPYRHSQETNKNIEQKGTYEITSRLPFTTPREREFPLHSPERGIRRVIKHNRCKRGTCVIQLYSIYSCFFVSHDRHGTSISHSTGLRANHAHLQASCRRRT